MSFRTYHEVPGADRSMLGDQVAAQRRRVRERLRDVRRVAVVMSGKGGVGKSFLTAMLARGAAAASWRVGVLDADLKSPTIARMLEATGPLIADAQGVQPAAGRDGIAVVSTDLLLAEGAPLRWRTANEDRFVARSVLEAGALRELLSDVAWGELDLLLIDMPPDADGIEDVAELVPGLAGAIVVTIPSEESRRSVERAMRCAADAGVRLLGVVENMSGYACDGCAAVRPLFAGDAGERLAASFRVPLFGKVPFSSAPHGGPLRGAFPPPVLDAVIAALGPDSSLL
ncbi:MAG: P-loop NTPase [Gemmatimonadota bacterium]|nr:P-loop NTPase [Gemmatimonadota bacterium]